MPTPEPRPVNRPAARAVAERAIPVVPDPAGRKELLDMLGLLGGVDLPCCCHEQPHPGITPDLTADERKSLGSPMAAVNSDLNEHMPTAKRSTNIYTPPPLNGALCPPGLRAVIQGAEPVDTPAVPTPVKPVPKVTPAPKPPKVAAPPKPVKPKIQRTVPNPARCGTDSGYKKHKRDGTPVCDACGDANRKENRERHARRRARKIASGEITPMRQPVKCGTPGGNRRHRREGTEVCEPCRLAHNANRRSYGWTPRVARSA